MNDDPPANSPADLGWTPTEQLAARDVSLTETQRLVLGRVDRGTANDFTDCNHIFALDDLRRMRLITRLTPKAPYRLTPAGERALAIARRRTHQ